jgi:site-specific recombinase XerD
MSALAPTLQAFFVDRLISQRNASPRTVAAYRDTLRLLLRFAQRKTGKQPCQLDFSDLDAPLIGAFLDHLEDERGNTPRTRNARLAAIHSLYRYAALRHPEHAQTIARVIEIPPKRYERALISYLDEHEIKALLRAPDRSSWLGRRDHALLLLAIQTGLRVTELTGLHIADVSLSTGAHVRVMGKSRKERCVTLTTETVAVLQQWLRERKGQGEDPLFPTRRGGPLTPKAVAWLLDKHTATATRRCPSLQTKRVTPHVTQAHQRDAATSPKHRHPHDRPVAWPREHQVHRDLSARRQQDQAAGDRPHRPNRNPTRPIPAPRRTTGLPRDAVIIRSTTDRHIALSSKNNALPTVCFR